MLRIPEGSLLRNPGRQIFSPPLLSPDAVRPWMCVWPPPLQRQLAETPHRRRSIVNFHITKMKLVNCDNRVFTTALLFGRRTGDRTQLSLERFSTRQTLPPAGKRCICRRTPFSTSGNTKSKLLSSDGEQPWHEQFRQTHRHGQSGFSLVVFDGALHHWGHVRPLDGGPGDHDLDDSGTDTAIPDDDIACLASYAFESVQPSSLPGSPEVVFGWRWLSRATSRTRNSAVQCPLTISTSRAFSRTTGSQSTFTPSCIPRGIQIRPRFSFQTPRQPARSFTDLLTALAAILDSRQPHHVPLLHSAWAVHEVVAEEHRILESVNNEVGTCTPGDWVKRFEVRFSLRARQLQHCFPQVTRSLLSRVPTGVLASGALCIASAHIRGRPLSRIGSSPWFLCCLPWVGLVRDGARW